MSVASAESRETCRGLAGGQNPQDAFARGFAHLDVYDQRRPFYPWLATIAVRLSHNWLRRHGRVVRREGTAIDDTREPERPATALQEFIADEEGRRVWTAVSALPSGERIAVTL